MDSGLPACDKSKCRQGGRTTVNVIAEKLKELGSELPPELNALPMQLSFTSIDLSLKEANARGVDLSEIGENDPIPVVLSTETPFERYGELWILSHAEGAVDLTRAKEGLSMLVEHGGNVDPYLGTRGKIDPALHIGIVQNIRVEKKRLVGDAYFEDHELAQRVRRGVLSKPPTRRFVSVGWQPMTYRTNEIDVKGAKCVKRTWTKWGPDEMSVVSIPQLPKAQFGQSADGNNAFPIQAEEVSPMKQPKMNQQVDPAAAAAGAGGGVTPPADPAAAAAAAAAPATPAAQPQVASATATAQVQAEASTARDKEVAAIMTLCASAGVPMTKATEFIEKGMTKEQAGLAILQEKQTLGAAQPGSEVIDRMSKRDRREYRYTRTFRNALTVYEGGTPSGLEWELEQDMRKAYPMSKGGFPVPWSLEQASDDPERPIESTPSALSHAMSKKFGQVMTSMLGPQVNAMGTDVAGGGAELVFHSRGELIDVFRASNVVVKMGARVMPGLSAPIEWGRATADPEVYHVGENPPTPVQESAPSFDTIQMSGKTLQGKVIQPKQLIQLASLDVEADIRLRLGIQHGLKTNWGALLGVGGQFQPVGLINTPGVQTYPMGGVPTYKKLTAMTGKVGDVDADFGSLGWVTTVPMAAAMQATDESAVGNGNFIWKGTFQEGRMANYPARATTVMPKTLGAGSDEHGLIYGKWDEIVIGLFGVMEVLFNPFLLADYGQCQYNTWQMYDSVVQRAQAFVQATGAKPE